MHTRLSGKNAKFLLLEIKMPMFSHMFPRFFLNIFSLTKTKIKTNLRLHS